MLAVRRAVTGEAVPVDAIEGTSVANLRAEVAQALGAPPSHIELLEGRRALEDTDLVPGTQVVALVKALDLSEELAAWARVWCTARSGSPESWQEFQGLASKPKVDNEKGIATVVFNYLECTPVESSMDTARIIYDLRAGRVRQVM
mmetsp:Transcript_12053/g.28303  ORF Transcript_12053/g.28303 Transcript_12053/m.28303 type:complete len:146 (+) Transcript_12053:48-485(+)